MLLFLAEYLEQFESAFGVFQYITLRGILATGTALAISLLVGPAMIRRLNYHQVGQAVRDDGPESHLSKSGTPTMGGALILVAIAVASVLWGDLRNPYLWIAILVTAVFGAVGWVDDYRKVVEKDSRGLPARWKYLWQSVAGLSAALYLYLAFDTPVTTELYIPFFKDFAWSMGPLFVILAYFVIVGASNAVNLTDGLDGLAILPTVLVGTALGIIAYLSWPSFADPLRGRAWAFCGSTPIRPRYSWAMSGPSPSGRPWVPWRSSHGMKSCFSSWAAFSCWKPCR